MRGARRLFEAAVLLTLCLCAHAGAPEARAEATVPTLTICAGADWVTTRPSVDSIVYQCKSVCPAQDGSDCTYPATDVLGNTLQTIAFVVDAMGGQIRWNTPSRIVAGVLQHYGGLGTAYTSDIYGADIRSLWVQLEHEGYRLVEPKWEDGIAGWFSRSSGDPTTLPALIVRPAAVMQWVRNHLVPSEVKFATVGCSGGSIATLGPVHWLGLASIVDYQYFSGALPAVYDIPAACAKTQSTLGICEADPFQSCTSDAPCGGSRCAFPQPVGALGSTSGNPLGESVKALIDYVLATGGKCVAGKSDPAFYRSSFKYVPGNLSYDYPVDTDNGVGGHPYWWTDPEWLTNQQYPNIVTDTNLGVTYSTGKIYTQIQTSQYKSHVLVPGTHCESQLNSSYLPEVLNKIRTGLGLPPPSPTD